MAGQDAHRGRCTPYRRHSARLVIRGTGLPASGCRAILKPAAGTQRAAYERARRLPGPCSGLLSRKGRAVKDVPQTRRRASARFPVARKCVRIKYPPTGQAPSPFASPSGRVARPRRGGPTSGAPFLLPIDLPGSRRRRRRAEVSPSRGRRMPPPLASNPHRFHEDRSEIAQDLVELARRPLRPALDRMGRPPRSR